MSSHGLWGGGEVKDVVTELPRLKHLGFTHCHGGEGDHQPIVQASTPTLVTKPEKMPATIEMLGTALAYDLRIIAGTWPTYFEPYLPVREAGRPTRISHCNMPACSPM